MAPSVDNTAMSLGRRPAACLLFGSLLAACGPGACAATPRIEICNYFEEGGACERPHEIAAGIRYTALVEGPSVPEGEVVLEIVRVLPDGSERSLATIEARKAERGARVRQSILLTELGRYRLEVRTSDGRRLGAKTFEVTVPTVR